jgi:hypothetical protein
MSSQIVREPRWPALVAMLAAAGMYLALLRRERPRGYLNSFFLFPQMLRREDQN